MDKKLSEYLSKIGSKGGAATKKKYGKEHYQRLAANMNAKRRAKKLTQVSDKTEL